MMKPIVGAGSQYLSAAMDKSGGWLDGGKNYGLHVPANVPVKAFWSVTFYDNMTGSMIEMDTNLTTTSREGGEHGTPWRTHHTSRPSPASSGMKAGHGSSLTTA